jgi:hypothetical protein
VKRSALIFILVLLLIPTAKTYKKVQALAQCKITLNSSDSIQNIITGASNGDVICLNTGQYNQSITINKSITLQNAPNQNPVLKGKSGTPTIINITADNVKVEGLTLENAVRETNSRYGWINIASSADNTNIVGNTLVTPQDYISPAKPNNDPRNNYKDYGITLSGPSNTYILENTIMGMMQGIHPKNMLNKKLVIEGNTISHTWQSGIHLGASGNAVSGGKNCSETAHVLIKNNIIEYSKIEDGIQTTQDFNDSDDNNTKNVGAIISGNVFRHNQENAVDVKGASCMVIEKNIIYGTVGDNDGPFRATSCTKYKKVGNTFVEANDGTYDMCSHRSITRGTRTKAQDIIIRQNVIFDSAPAIDYRGGSTNYRIYNNTVVNPNRNFKGGNRTDEGEFSALRLNSISGVKILNNIFAETTDEQIISTASAKNISSDYNLFYDTSGASFKDTSGTKNFNQWKSYSNSEQNSIEANPGFVKSFSGMKPDANDYNNYNFIENNFELKDFYLGANSAAVDSGGALTKTSGSGNGKQVKVLDAAFFTDGQNVVQGDTIKINNQVATITNINYATNTLTLNTNINYQNGNNVYLNYNGNAPDIGAYEYGGSAVLTPTGSTPTPTSTFDPKFDLDKNGKVDLNDVIALIKFIFQ